MEVLDKHPRMEDRLRSIDSTTWSTEIGVIVGLTSGSAMSKDPTNDSDMRQGAEAQQEAIIDLTGPETSG